MMKIGAGHLQENLLKWLPSRDELAPYVAAISSLKDFQSSNEELIEASRLLNDCHALERATVAFLAGGPDGSEKATPAAVRRALHALKQRRLADEWKAQRVIIAHEQIKGAALLRSAAHPVPGHMSYWYRTSA